MTREDILRMARESEVGLAIASFGALKELERFAALVAAAEREACAQVCDDLKPTNPYYESYSSDWDVGTLDCAAAIRARSNA